MVSDLFDVVHDADDVTYAPRRLLDLGREVRARHRDHVHRVLHKTLAVVEALEEHLRRRHGNLRSQRNNSQLLACFIMWQLLKLNNSTKAKNSFTFCTVINVVKMFV